MLGLTGQAKRVAVDSVPRWLSTVGAGGRCSVGLREYYRENGPSQLMGVLTYPCPASVLSGAIMSLVRTRPRVISDH